MILVRRSHVAMICFAIKEGMGYLQRPFQHSDKACLYLQEFS